CVSYITGLLGEAPDREVIQGLSRTKDLKVRNGVSFEITPPTDEDAYQGWWISVFSEQKLNASRASDKELNEISVAKTDAAKAAKNQDNNPSWSAEELKLSRPSQPETISFFNSEGEAVTNVEVLRVDNAYLYWRRGGMQGRVRLSDLPESVSSR